MVSATCPLPTAHSWTTVKSAYDKARLANPGLTPAAWRKAAAQDLGMDYNTFLAIFKTKGKTSMVPASTPTLSASQVRIGIPHVVGKSKMPIKKAAAPPPHKPVPTVTEELADAALDVEGATQVFMKGLTNTDELQDALLYILEQAPDSVKVDVKNMIVQAMNSLKVDPSHSFKQKIYAVKAVAKKMPIKKAAPSPGVEVNQVLTSTGQTLSSDLVKFAYKKMKMEMPGATPAVLRKAAADYLGVDYNDFLKAWKSTKPAKVSAIKSEADLPNNGAVPLHPSADGKYKDLTPTTDQVKDELFKLYGPGASKNYMQISIDTAGQYTTLIPKSVVPTQAGVDAVVAGMRKLGFNVIIQGHKITVWTDKAKAAISKNAEEIAKNGTYTLPNGTKVLDMPTAERATNRWWSSLTSEQRDAWNVYTGSGYRAINGGLRKGGGSTQAIRDLSATMEKTKEQFTVFRGTSIDLSEFKVGGLWSDKGFMSTAVNPGGSWSGVKFEITVMPGTKGRYIGNKSRHPGENEFLLDHGTQFRVLSINGNTVRLVTIP